MKRRNRCLDMIDGRSPEDLLADGDARWPDGTRYTPSHLKGEERERFREAQDRLESNFPK